jgi:hypothetical protein
MGISYNAEAFVDFRTNATMDHTRTVSVPDTDTSLVGPSIKHRIDNYPPDWAVIIHDENSVGPRAGVSPRGDYVYGFFPEGGAMSENRFDEARISFNNTWGPTLADGDDYFIATSSSWLTCNTIIFGCPGVGEVDNWDYSLAYTNGTIFVPGQIAGYNQLANSIAEVEEAIREDGQVYTSFYFDRNIYQNADLRSWYFAFFPTKFFYGEDYFLRGQTSLVQLKGGTSYVNESVAWLLNLAKPVGVEVWNTEEIPLRAITADCPQSPCLPGSQASTSLGQELSIFDIGWMKGLFTGDANAFTRGRVVLFSTLEANTPTLNAWGSVSRGNPTWPFLAYTFDVESDFAQIGHWRSMQR